MTADDMHAEMGEAAEPDGSKTFAGSYQQLFTAAFIFLNRVQTCKKKQSAHCGGLARKSKPTILFLHSDSRLCFCGGFPSCSPPSWWQLTLVARRD
jgi:hypothetical protein